MSSVSLLERAAAGRSWNPRVACAAVLTLVFLCGAAAGALIMDLGVHNRMRPPAFYVPQNKALNFDRLQKDLNLTPAQSEQVQSILNDFWQYYRTVLSECKNRIEQVLTEEQRQKFERILQERQR